MSISRTKGYAYWPAYDPLDSSISTLEKVVDKYVLEDSGAYKQISRMLRGNSQFEKYLGRKAQSQKKRDNKEFSKGKTSSKIKKRVKLKDK